ncbi:unnamed protein product [Arctogadus glacialis]
MSFANLKLTPSHQLALRASDAAAAFTAAMGPHKERSAEAASTPPPPASSSSGPSTSTSKAAASTVLPPRKPTAPNFSALVRGRPMGPGELQAQIRKLMTPPARPAVPGRDQRPSVPLPPTTQVTDEELVQMVTDVEMGNWHHTGRVAL